MFARAQPGGNNVIRVREPLSTSKGGSVTRVPCIAAAEKPPRRRHTAMSIQIDGSVVGGAEGASHTLALDGSTRSRMGPATTSGSVLIADIWHTSIFLRVPPPWRPLAQ